MQKKFKLILDTHCEVYNVLKSYADGIFWNFAKHVADRKLVTGAVYVICREQMKINASLVRQLLDQKTIKVIFSDPTEGSYTLQTHCHAYGIADLVQEQKIIVISGGDMAPSWPCLTYECFLPKIFDYSENVSAATRMNEIFVKTHKPFKFLFLNGRARQHRFRLMQRFTNTGLLNQSLWSNLDSRCAPIHYLPEKYEVDRYRNRLHDQVDSEFVKTQLFNDEWGDVYLQPESYIDTFFSLVTETVFDIPFSFRTEKIWKPIAMGHPWIAVANQGFYQDMRDLGFQTFDHVVDESFDTIENNQDRLERIATVVEDLCQQDLASFLKECYNVCKYNQQHLEQMRHKVRKEFPDRFFQFIDQYKFNE